MYHRFKPKTKSEELMVKVVENELPDYVSIVSEELDRGDKWPQEWSGTYTIFNSKTNKYFEFSFMGNDDEGVTDFLDNKFREVKPKTIEKIIYT
jgi:hypothetical protein